MPNDPAIPDIEAGTSGRKPRRRINPEQQTRFERPARLARPIDALDNSTEPRLAATKVIGPSFEQEVQAPRLLSDRRLQAAILGRKQLDPSSYLVSRHRAYPGGPWITMSSMHGGNSSGMNRACPSPTGSIFSTPPSNFGSMQPDVMENEP